MHASDSSPSVNKHQLNKNLESKNYFNSNKLFGRFNIGLAKRTGSINASALMSELVDQYLEDKKNDNLTPDFDDGVHWCILNRKKIEENTSLKFHAQEEAFHLLIVEGLIQFVKKDKDSIVYFRLSPTLIHGSKELL